MGLKIHFNPPRDKGFIDYSPAHMHVLLNGEEIHDLQELTLTIDQHRTPNLSIKFTLDNIDIDMDSLTALEAIVKQREGDNGQSKA